MKRIAITASALVALIVGSPANSADVPVKGPIYKAAPAPVFSWAGFYFGGHVGYGWSVDQTFGTEADGFLGGIQAGYNWQFSRNWVLGVEADIAGTDINVTNAFGTAHIDYIGTARARLGYAWDRMMIYGTGGFAYARVGVNGVHSNGEGYALGAGLEWAFAHRWSAKIEYMFHDLDFAAGDLEVSTIKFGVNYRF